MQKLSKEEYNRKFQLLSATPQGCRLTRELQSYDTGKNMKYDLIRQSIYNIFSRGK